MGERRWLPFALISVVSFTVAALGAASACSSFSSDGEAKADAALGTVVDGGGGTDAADASPSTPVELVAGQGVVRRLAVRDGAIYWGNTDGVIGTCQIASCGSTVRTLAQGYPDATSPGALAVDDTYVYWTGYLNSVVFRTKIGMSAVPLVPERFADFDKGLHWPVGIVVDQTTVYWSSQNPDEIRACPRTGPCGDAGNVLTAMPLQFPFTRTLVANTQKVFWVAGDFGSDAGAVFSSPKDGTPAPTAVAYDVSGPRGIAVFDNAVYVASWAEPPSGTPAPPGVIYRFVGPSRAALATSELRPMTVAADAENVYWTNQGDGTIRRCAAAGCGEKPTTIATPGGVPDGIIVDDASIYWADSASGKIFQMKK